MVEKIKLVKEEECAHLLCSLRASFFHRSPRRLVETHDKQDTSLQILRKQWRDLLLLDGWLRLTSEQLLQGPQAAATHSLGQARKQTWALGGISS